MNKRQEEFGKFVVSRGDASEMLDPAEEALDQIAAFVDMPVERARVEPIGAWRDDRLSALRSDGGDKGIRVVALVGYNELRWLPLDQGSGLINLADARFAEVCGVLNQIVQLG